jgi:hypothetical protein
MPRRLRIGYQTNRTLTADQGGYVLTGQAAGIYPSRIITAARGTFTLTGQDSTLTYSGSAGTGHRWTDVTGGMWSQITTEASGQGDTNASGYQARIAAIPTTSATQLTSGGNIQSAINALSSSGTLMLRSGTYFPTSMTTLTGTKKMIVAAGEVATIDGSSFTDIFNPMFNMTGTNVISGSGGVLRFINIPTRGIQMWGSSVNSTIHHVSVDGGIIQDASTGGAGLCAFYDSVGGLICSCEVMNLTDAGTGGNCDGIQLSHNNALNANNAVVDVHAYRNSDDGFDTWQSDAAQYFYFCTSVQNGKNVTGPNGDGNGFKLGTGAGRHNLFHCDTTDNGDYGYNYNGNSNSDIGGSSWPRLKACTSTGDDSGPYQGGSAYYNVVP